VFKFAEVVARHMFYSVDLYGWKTEKVQEFLHGAQDTAEQRAKSRDCAELTEERYKCMLTDSRLYTANLCPFWWHVVNAIRRLAGESVVALRIAKRKATAGIPPTVAQTSRRTPSMTKFERKRNDGNFAELGAITLEHWPLINAKPLIEPAGSA